MSDVKLLSLDELEQALLCANVGHVARETGLSWVTVNNIKRGRSGNYTLKTLRSLSSYLASEQYSVYMEPYLCCVHI